jgi:uncharacterized membrane protein YdjX (TVP38/TMEM64 family)
VLAVFVGALVLFFVLGGHRYVSFEAIKQSRETLLNYTEQHYALVLTASFFIYMVSVALSLPVATILSLAVGLLFGRWVGTAVIVVAGTLGATLLLLAARYVFTDVLKRRAGKHLKKFDDVFQKNAFLYLAFLRVVPIFPFWLINLASAFTSISLLTYITATATGMVPISFVWAQLGESLEHINEPADALSGTTLIALTALGLLGVAAILTKNLVFDKKKKR